MKRPVIVLGLLACGSLACLMLWRGSARSPASEPEDAKATDTVGAAPMTASSSRSPVPLPGVMPSRPDAPRIATAGRDMSIRPSSGPPEGAVYRQALLERLLGFRDEARLDETQWKRLLSDLYELSKLEGQMRLEMAKGRVEIEDTTVSDDDLGRDLDDRMAGYLDSKQLRQFRFRFASSAGLLSQVTLGGLLEDGNEPGVMWHDELSGLEPHAR